MSARLRRLQRIVTGGPVAPGLAVVTGTSSGIGRSTAILLAQRGYRVIAGVRRPEDAAAIADAHERIEPFFLDITSREHLEALRERLGREPDGLRLLVNNAESPASAPSRSCRSSGGRRSWT